MGHTRISDIEKFFNVESAMEYHMPASVHAIPTELLDLRPDDEIDQDLVRLRPVSDEKNVWFYWHSGFKQMQVQIECKVTPTDCW